MNLRWAAVGVVAVGALVGCSSTSATGVASSMAPIRASSAAVVDAHASDAPNPVTLLRKLTGCVIAAGVVDGDHDLLGDRVASCDYQDNSGSAGTDVTIYTAAGTPAVQLQADDSHKLISGPHFVALVTGDWSSYSSTFDVDSVAQSLGGKVIAPAG